ncbi:MAG: hypothetical protein COB51_09500 [Moraxellaceae bacterium]|nr:MAG: hypothetical protein COB51_09500 [Moraxellaceae bacterium]
MVNDYKNVSIVDLAALIANHLHEHGIEVVLVGGLAVEIYSKNLYLTKDIDMVNISYNEPAIINKAMDEIAFQKQGRVYVSQSTDVCVEFPTAPLAIGNQLIKETTVIHTPGGDIPILLASDVVKDRLSAYFHWQDNPSMVQALSVMINHDIDLNEVKRFCVIEGRSEEYRFIEKLYRNAKQRRLASMVGLEEMMLEEIIKGL